MEKKGKYRINKVRNTRYEIRTKASTEIFNEEGVVFIGAFLPSRAMHAWVIEKGIQPDQRDNIWHQYRPIAAIC